MILPTDPVRARERPRSLLAVDDDPFYRHLYGHFGKMLFDDVATVECAAKITRKALNAADVLVLDLDMPGTDGMHFLTEIVPKSIRRNPDLQVVICSGMDRRVVELARRAAHLVGLKHVSMLYKPFSAADLRHALDLEPRHRLTTRHNAEELEKATVLELEEAMQKGNIQPYWQPQISTQTGQVSGFEVLSRWHHPTHGVLMPGHFVNAMESQELAMRYALAMLDKALLSVETWGKAVNFKGRISLNAPPSAITNPAFTESLLAILKERQFPEQRLVLEVTEHVAAANDSQLLAGLARIMMHNIQLSIDDFGTGHSSLDRLGTEAFNEIKIDRSFVGVLDISETTRAITRSIIQTARAEGLRVVAEGVSDRTAVANLSEMGCTDLQGSYFTMPLPEQDLVPWFKESAGYFPEARYVAAQKPGS